MKFWLGTHQPHWLATAGVPLFVSRRTLHRRRTLPRAAAMWALDSGGFTELSMHGSWDALSPRAYADEVQRYRDEIGRLAFAAPQDWMCEPWICQQTGLSVAMHQQRTIDNYLTLMSIAPDLPWIPVLQGWTLDDYLRHIEAYAHAEIALERLSLVGVGSVCRRQRMAEGARIVASIASQGIAVHAFGFKQTGLDAAWRHIASADSLAWSFAARYVPPMTGHTHKNCANCLPFALRWREQLLHRCTHTHQCVQLAF